MLCSHTYMYVQTCMHVILKVLCHIIRAQTHDCCILSRVGGTVLKFHYLNTHVRWWGSGQRKRGIGPVVHHTAKCAAYCVCMYMYHVCASAIARPDVCNAFNVFDVVIHQWMWWIICMLLCVRKAKIISPKKIFPDQPKFFRKSRGNTKCFGSGLISSDTIPLLMCLHLPFSVSITPQHNSCVNATCTFSTW